MTTADALPIDEVMPEILRALAAGSRLVLAAPPGAGKTTRVPLALAGLLGAPGVVEGRILMLEPRRVAARMAAERMASSLGERLGQTIGLTTRVDRKVSKDTRIEVITDGLFTRRILSDQALAGVGAVLFDEFHERRLNSDLGLALALETQAVLREDLRLLIMSATLDTAAVSRAIDAPVIESAGRMYPVETRYLGRSDDRIEERMAKVIRQALREQEGSILAFLPGAREINRTAEALAGLGPDILIALLYGALSPAEQDAAVSPAPVVVAVRCSAGLSPPIAALASSARLSTNVMPPSYAGNTDGCTRTKYSSASVGVVDSIRTNQLPSSSSSMSM